MDPYNLRSDCRDGPLTTDTPLMPAHTPSPPPPPPSPHTFSIVAPTLQNPYCMQCIRASDLPTAGACIAPAPDRRRRPCSRCFSIRPVYVQDKPPIASQGVIYGIVAQRLNPASARRQWQSISVVLGSTPPPPSAFAGAPTALHLFFLLLIFILANGVFWCIHLLRQSYHKS
ncbi:hypothetical protein BDR22DRAFT_241127 [Usnea florida]